MIRRIRDLLYDQGFTINGARNQLHELAQSGPGVAVTGGTDMMDAALSSRAAADPLEASTQPSLTDVPNMQLLAMRRELFEIRALLTPVP